MVEQMAEADRLAIEVYGIELLQMMEHAGRALADVVMTIAPDDNITVLAGGGSNGGGGLCAARHLLNRDRTVSVVLGSDRIGASDFHSFHRFAASSTTAAMLTAARALIAAGIEPEHDLVFAGVAQEETGLVGMRDLYDEYRETAREFIDVLGDGRRISYGALGIHWWKVIATGPGHGIQLPGGRLVVPIWLAFGDEGDPS